MLNGHRFSDIVRRVSINCEKKLHLGWRLQTSNSSSCGLDVRCLYFCFEERMRVKTLYSTTATSTLTATGRRTEGSCARASVATSTCRPTKPRRGARCVHVRLEMCCSLSLRCIIICYSMCVCLFVRARARACMHVCMCMCRCRCFLRLFLALGYQSRHYTY